MEYLYYQLKIEIVRMKIDKNNLEYSNEHPKTKKLSKDQSIKLAKYKGNGKVGDKFMKIYNNYINDMDFSPVTHLRKRLTKQNILKELKDRPENLSLPKIKTD